MKHEQRVIKKKVLELLEQNPIVETACNKVGISRATFYRWVKNSKTFKRSFEQARKVGNDRLCDLAESKLMQNIEKGDQRAVEFLLKNKGSEYSKNEINLNYIKKIEVLELKEKREELKKEHDRVLDVIKNLINNYNINYLANCQNDSKNKNDNKDENELGIISA